MITLGVGHEQPSHPAAQIAIGMRPDHQVEVVGHQAVSQEIQGQAGGGIRHGLDESVVLGGLMDHGLAAIAAIENVIPHAGDGGSCGPWDDRILPQGSRQPQYSFRPFFFVSSSERLSSMPASSPSAVFAGAPDQRLAFTLSLLDRPDDFLFGPPLLYYAGIGREFLRIDFL